MTPSAWVDGKECMDAMDIVLADDHNLVREGLKPFLERLGDDVRVREAADIDSALKQANAASDLGLIILDLMMPGMDGFVGLKTIHKAFPAVPVVMLSGHVSRADVLAAIDAGAAGYIPKTISGSALVSALRLVLDGERYLPSIVLSDDDAPPPVEASAMAFQNLTAREKQVLRLLVDGQTNKEIARALDLQEITVKVHVRNIYRKIAVTNRAQAVKTAIEAGFVG